METKDLPEEVQVYLLEHKDELLSQIILFNELMNKYDSAIKEVTTKLEILKNDLQLHNNRDCITAIQARIKTPVSILNKLTRKGLTPNLVSIRDELNDVAGIRVICSYIDDIYMLAKKLSAQDDIRVVRVKDYIKSPKPNGYRSYHLILEVPVFFSESKEMIRVEVQMRTVAMDFWASLEHDMRYKKEIRNCREIGNGLKECADTIHQTDLRMMELRNHISSTYSIRQSKENV